MAVDTHLLKKMSILGDIFQEEEMGEAGPSSHRLPDHLVGRDSQQFVGLQNQGTTCYLNSLLQVLFMSPELREGLYQVGIQTLPSGLTVGPRIHYFL